MSFALAIVVGIFLYGGQRFLLERWYILENDDHDLIWSTIWTTILITGVINFIVRL